MNNVILIGRLCKDVEIKNTENTTIGRYTLAVDRYGKDKGADFIPCVCFGKSADFADKYLKKGMKIAVEGRIQTGSYTNKDGNKVYTTDVIVNAHHFCEGKTASTEEPATPATPDDFMNVPSDINDEVPWN